MDRKRGKLDKHEVKDTNPNMSLRQVAELAERAKEVLSGFSAVADRVAALALTLRAQQSSQSQPQAESGKEKSEVSSDGALRCSLAQRRRNWQLQRGQHGGEGD